MEGCVEEAIVVGREKGGFGEGRRESLSCGHCCAKEKSEEDLDDKVSSRFSVFLYFRAPKMPPLFIFLFWNILFFGK